MTGTQSNLFARLFLLAVAVALASGAAYFALGYRGGKSGGDFRPSVEIIDRADEFAQAMDERIQEAEEAGEVVGDLAEVQLLPKREDREAFAEFMRARVPKGMVFDPLMFMRRPAHMSRQQTFDKHPKGGWEIRTNDYGMRNDRDVAAERPALRILVTGDSHTEGMCGNAESFSAVLEQNLSKGRPAGEVEVLNAGLGNYNPFHYLGVVESYVQKLRPHVMVIAMYGGNDYAGAIKLQRFFSRRGNYESGPHTHKVYSKALKVKTGLVSQELGQVLYFMNNPADEAVCARVMLAISHKAADLCEEAGVLPLFVYLPPATLSQPDLHRELVATVTGCDALTEEDLAVSNRITDVWLAGLTQSGLATIDMRPILQETEELAYWDGDRHINLLGHRLVAEAIEPKVREMLGL